MGIDEIMGMKRERRRSSLPNDNPHNPHNRVTPYNPFPLVVEWEPTLLTASSFSRMDWMR